LLKTTSVAGFCTASRIHLIRIHVKLKKENYTFNWPEKKGSLHIYITAKKFYKFLMHPFCPEEI
jgi:hypothetical protein